MTLRESLARWLSPELAREADKSWWLQMEMQEMKRWLGSEFPIVEVALDRLTVGAANHFRSLDAQPIRQVYPNLGGIWPWQIYSFREKLRQVFGRVESQKVENIETVKS